MCDKIYLNDLGIVTSQGIGQKATLDACRGNKKREFTLIEMENINYEVCRCKFYDVDDNRIDTLLDIACKQISETVEHFISKYGYSRIGVILGSTDNGSEQSLNALNMFKTRNNFPKGYTLVNQQAHRPADYIKDHFKLKSIATTISTACTSSGSSIVLAVKMLRAGLLDAVIVGGVDIVSESVLKGFISLDAIDPNITNPFSKNRRGINLGEAGALFVMSRDKTSGSNIILSGYGEASDAFHSTAPDPEGKGAAMAMNRALRMSGNPKIDYINLHGTGTILNDNMECAATKNVFKKSPLLSSTKPIFGHTLGAASAVELGICWLLLKESGDVFLPIHKGDGEYMDFIEHMNFINKNNALNKIARCMSNSYAFGGCNVSLIIEREDSCD